MITKIAIKQLKEEQITNGVKIDANGNLVGNIDTDSFQINPTTKAIQPIFGTNGLSKQFARADHSHGESVELNDIIREIFIKPTEMTANGNFYCITLSDGVPYNNTDVLKVTVNGIALEFLVVNKMDDPHTTADQIEDADFRKESTTEYVDVVLYSLNAITHKYYKIAFYSFYNSFLPNSNVVVTYIGA